MHLAHQTSEPAQVRRSVFTLLTSRRIGLEIPLATTVQLTPT